MPSIKITQIENAKTALQDLSIRLGKKKYNYLRYDARNAENPVVPQIKPQEIFIPKQIQIVPVKPADIGENLHFFG